MVSQCAKKRITVICLYRGKQLLKVKKRDTISNKYFYRADGQVLKKSTIGLSHLLVVVIYIITGYNSLTVKAKGSGGR
jgi:hypothetical protein